MQLTLNANGSLSVVLTAEEAVRFNALLAGRPGGPSVTASTSFTVPKARVRPLAYYLSWSEGGELEVRDEAVATRDSLIDVIRQQSRPRICDGLDALLGIVRS